MKKCRIFTGMWVNLDAFQKFCVKENNWGFRVCAIHEIHEEEITVYLTDYYKSYSEAQLELDDIMSNV